jgi:hypothetical protein
MDSAIINDFNNIELIEVPELSSTVVHTRLRHLGALSSRRGREGIRNSSRYGWPNSLLAIGQDLVQLTSLLNQRR